MAGVISFSCCVTKQQMARRLDLKNLVNENAAGFPLYYSVLAVPNFIDGGAGLLGCLQEKKRGKKSTWRYYDVYHSGAMCLVFTLLKTSKVCEC